MKKITLEAAIQSNGFLSEQEKTCLNLIFAGALMHQSCSQFFKHYELSEPQYNVLRILRGHHPKPMLSNDIQNRMLHKSSNTSRIIDKLIKNELVRKRKNSVDQREVYHFITKKGLALLRKIDKPLIEHCANIIPLEERGLKALNSLIEKVYTPLFP